MADYLVAERGITADHIVDLRGLNSPLPLLRIKKEIANLTSGQILQADGTDPGCRNDFPGWCSRIGHRYLGEVKKKNCISFYIRKE